MGCCALTAFRIQRNQQGVQAIKWNNFEGLLRQKNQLSHEHTIRNRTFRQE